MRRLRRQQKLNNQVKALSKAKQSVAETYCIVFVSTTFIGCHLVADTDTRVYYAYIAQEQSARRMMIQSTETGVRSTERELSVCLCVKNVAEFLTELWTEPRQTDSQSQSHQRQRCQCRQYRGWRQNAGVANSFRKWKCAGDGRRDKRMKWNLLN